MKNRKLRSAKAGSSKRKVPSDVSPSTSLPPLVEGQLRCFLRVTISRVLWTIHKPPAATFVRLRWWGESSSGTYFCPRDGSQASQKSVKTTARFPIRCGPKQFTSYLTDMGSLVLEVMTKLDHLPIARAQVAGISRLALSHPISGFYTLLSPTSEKLGELQVSVSLEVLTEAYDSSSSSVPATDNSTDAPQVTTLLVPSQSRPESAGSSGANTPRGKDYLYFTSAQRKEGSLENQMPTTDQPQRRAAANPLTQEACNDQAPDDILSVILERGSKLRNAMVVSALKCDVDSGLALKDTALPRPKDNNILPSSKLSVPLSGRFLQEILHADSSLQRAHSAAGLPSCLRPDGATDTESRAVDLLLGSLNGSSLPLWDGDGSPPESLSGHSSVCWDSELNDPQYDQSLLENLFYKTPMPGDMEVEDERGMSYSKSQTNKGTSSEAQDQLKHSGPKRVGYSDSDHERPPRAGDGPSGLSLDQLTALRRTRLARVAVHSLSVPTDSSAMTPRKSSGKEKPPRPLLNKKCFFFVEYTFPVASGFGGRDRAQVTAGEVTRMVSSKVTRGVVKFQQHCVFPFLLSGATLEHWWGSDLTFKIFSRKSTQKKPVPVGQAVYPLRHLLQREQLSHSVVLPVWTMEGTSESQDIGPLKVSLELAADNKDFSAKSELSVNARTPSHTVASPQRGPCPKPQPGDDNAGREDGPVPDSMSAVGSVQRASPGPSPLSSLHTSPRGPHRQAEEDYEVLLHALLMVPGGKDLDCGPKQPPNLYLNCKLFGSDETARSVMSWGQTNPSFSFVQVTPVALTTKLLERMKNNVMVIEVWQRSGSPVHDRLLGLVKLPLHQFYMSFRDPKITHLLLQAQYPVVGVDCYMPVVDVFSGSCKGDLAVLLAMGQSGQIVALQRMRNEEFGSVSHLPRPTHLLDHQPYSGKKVSTGHAEAMTEHVFVVRVEKARGLTPLQSTVWGEADCYVQYTFPSQEGDPAPTLDSDLIGSSVNLKAFRTGTTLCVPDPVFAHSDSHALLAPEGVPVQRLLLSSLSGHGLASGGGVQFEVWCRYYYPNVREQLVARGTLPLSRLCAMVTLQRQQPTEPQSFSLPLVPRTDSPSGQQPLPSAGLLDVCVRYTQQPRRLGGQRGGALASGTVTLVVQVHRASGLQAAARALAEKDAAFQYYADVGANAYVAVQLSFLPASERRSTRVAPRTFCPEFDHHTEFPCELRQRRSGGETHSLAELLQEASAVFTVWNRDSRKVMDTLKSKDTLLGTVKIPLANLMQRRTGISGWFGLYLPQDLASSHDHRVLVGGLELSVNFAHHADRERVVKVAQALGWEVGRGGEEEEEEEENQQQQDDGGGVRTMSLTVSMPRVWLPIHCLLLPGHSELQRSTYCYYRYQLYDQEAFCSRVKHPSAEEEGGLATVAFQGARTVELRSSQPLLWYLREERLEVQVWVAFRKERTRRPHDTDRLVGSAFVDLSSLAKRPRHKLTLSGVYPLFRRSAPDLSGAALRVHIALTPGSLPEELAPRAQDRGEPDSLGELSSGEEAVEEDGPPPAVASRRTPRTQGGHQTSVSAHTEASRHAEEDAAFAVTVTVDRAMHLSLTGCPLTERGGGTPSCCVSYMTADSSEPVSTALIANSDCPVWDHHHECRLSKQLLVDPQQSLVFKVWHRGDVERVIGFASVDLFPLLSGFQSVCGWYNITDFSGQCQGQIKVSISPLRGVQELRGQRRAVNQEASKTSTAPVQALPLNYHTAGAYSSFPSHISRYTEQKISSPDRMDRLFSERSSESERHDEHMESVRLHHQRLQEGGAARRQDPHPSSSALSSALRRNLSELDDIQRYFSRKLSTPAFPSVAEQQGWRQEEPRDSEADRCQLLLRSSRLVGEVDSLINGLQGDRLETIISDDPQSSSPTPPSADDRPLPASAESVPCSHRPAVSPLQNVSPVASPLPGTSKDHMDSQSEEEQDGHHHRAAASEDEEEGATGGREEEEADDDGDYEETVVEPRPLNEVTSLTDKTSPWTSILSDPDLGSQESLEALGEQPARSSPDLTREGEEGRSPCEECTCTSVDDSEIFHSDGSAGDMSDTEGEALREREDADVTNGGPGDIMAVRPESPSPSLSPGPQHPMSTYDTSCPLHDEEAQPQPSPPLEIPNFFLPSHHLEASMRVLRLAPAFSQSTSDPGPSGMMPGAPHRQIPRQKPRIPASSMKKAETQRIAQIFASHLNEEH